MLPFDHRVCYTISMSNPTAASVYANQKQLQALEANAEKWSYEEAAEAAHLRDEVWEAQDEMGGTIYRIPVQAFEPLQKKIEKITRRCNKLGIDAPYFVDTGEREETKISKNKIQEWGYVAVSGQAPALKGWTFLATLAHEEVGTIIRRVPNAKFEGTDIIDTAYFRQAKPVCDHCNTRRARKDTYLVRNEDGEIRQVGSNCLADFLGGLSPAQAAKGMEYIWDVMETTRGYETSDEFFTPYESAQEFLAHVALMVEKYGWVSGKAEYEYGPISTRHRAQDNMDPLLPESGLNPEERHFEIARETISYLADEERFEDDSDFAHNLRVIMQEAETKDVMKYRNMGIAAYGVVAYQRYISREAEIKKAAERTNEHFGQVGTRIDLALRVQSIRPIEGGYGMTYLHTMYDADGRTFKWFGTYSLEVETTYTGKWTIKKHDEWKGTKQTMINRPHGLNKKEI